MRWIVEVSSLGKTDLQKFCVEAESWQRALQAARTQRGEEGPMSGFSIELLEEGYRAVDPVLRVRFVVKRTTDDTPLTAPLAGSPARGSVAPGPASLTSAAEPKSAATTPSSAPPAAKSMPPRPGDKSAPPTSATSATVTDEEAAGVEPPPGAAAGAKSTLEGATAAPPPVGSPLPGLPAVRVLSTREQDPTDASPLTYREYSFLVARGTTEDVASDVLRGQLKLVEAHLAKAKMGKLVNLAVFDVEFTGKPPPPLATLSWKDWKSAPVIGYPRRGAAQKQVKPPSDPPPPGAPTIDAAASPFPLSPSSIPPASPGAAIAPSIPQAPLPRGLGFDGPSVFPPPQAVYPSMPPPVASSAPPPAHASVPPPPAHASVPPPPAHASVPPPPDPVSAPVALPTAIGTPAIFEMPVASGAASAGDHPPTSRRGSSPEGMVRTPSGRFVRGRTTGDELITALFESMHDLHFLRDALDGGQFCLALATEVLPARAAIIHFFDVEKREWVIACTRGKDTSRLLTLRTPEHDDLLRDAARRRRAVVLADAAAVTAQRYQSLGGTRSLIVAPIMQAGRALGALEIINPLDGMPFTDDEGNAMTYIAEQFAEYLGSRGIVVDTARIQAAAAR